MAYFVIHKDNHISIQKVPLREGKCIQIPMITQYIKDNHYSCFYAKKYLRRDNYKSTKLIRLIMVELAIDLLPVEYHYIIFDYIKEYEWAQVMSEANWI